MNLKGKVAYITGGSKGIGFGVAKKLAAVGMKVALSGRTLKTVEKAAEYLGDASNVLALESDVTNLSSEKAAIEKIKTWVNNGTGNVATKAHKNQLKTFYNSKQVISLIIMSFKFVFTN